MDLAAWNQRLASHFGALARDRKDVPVFALEHGLAPAELLLLQNLVRADILVSAPAVNHQLAWVVYAAEIGYGYAGNEYWQTFEDKTPGWTSNGRREWIRDAFFMFQNRFRGAKPSGPWAEHFSIIAWPITHAILPRDLQQQLAQILYDLRHAFSAELFDNPKNLGDFIAARSWDTSARFRNLVQAPALVGQIAAALLFQGKGDLKSLLHPMTLKRIGDDVDRERRGRNWLRVARRAAEERAEIRGLSICRPSDTTIHAREEARNEVARLGIEPRLVLRRIDGECWEVSLEIPDLSQLLLRFPQLRNILTESRCIVAGAAGRPLARGRCLHGRQRIPLSRWPRPEDVLLKFERTDPQIEFLLRAECMLRPGPSWLFKIASDGLAYELRGMRVRAATNYLLVSTERFARSPFTRSVELSCEGVYAVLLELPPTLSTEWEQALRELRITQAKSIEVWPVGLAAVAWDGEGRGEWLASETPTLAIQSDYAIDELTMAMGEETSLSLTLTDLPSGEPIFVELPLLPVGLHTFLVSARSGPGKHSEVVGDLEVVMRVREARPWSRAATMHGPLEVELDPAAPTFEELWEGKAAVVVRGPAGRQAKCRIRMYVRAGETPSFERQLPPVCLPLSSEEWSRHFEAHLKRDKGAQRAYDDAHDCEVEFWAEELGVFTLRCEREFAPLRWSLVKGSSGFIARLVDDAGTGALVIERYPFEHPTVVEKLTPDSLLHKVPRNGGLYAATLREFRAAIIVPPIVRELADLQFEPHFNERERTPTVVSRLLASARLWGEARLSGDPIAGARQRTVIRTITAQLFSLIGGSSWERAEMNIAAPNGLAQLKRSISQERLEVSVGEKLELDAKRLANLSPGQRVVSLASLADDYWLVASSVTRREVAGRSSRPGVTEVRRIHGSDTAQTMWVVEFALRLASNPVTLEAWAGVRLEDGIKTILDAPTLARAARFLVLAVDRQKQSITAVGELYAGWEWAP